MVLASLIGQGIHFYRKSFNLLKKKEKIHMMHCFRLSLLCQRVPMV